MNYGKEAVMSTARVIVDNLTAAQLDQLCVNTIRTLSIDAVQQANSGHPGTPMALAPLVYTIWNRVLRFDPQNPIWPNRDVHKHGDDIPDVKNWVWPY
jgi:transketolase